MNRYKAELQVTYRIGSVERKDGSFTQSTKNIKSIEQTIVAESFDAVKEFLPSLAEKVVKGQRHDPWGGAEHVVILVGFSIESISLLEKGLLVVA